MARGRRPKPIEQKIADGNPGRRPLPEPLRSGDPLPAEPPEVLGAAGRELWTALTTRLNGVLDGIDVFALTAFCLVYDRAVDAGKVVDAEGQVARGSTGQLVEHPSLKTERAQLALFLKFASEFAATPVARARAAAAQAVRQEQAELDAITSGDAIEIDDVIDLDEEL